MLVILLFSEPAFQVDPDAVQRVIALQARPQGALMVRVSCLPRCMPYLIGVQMDDGPPDRSIPPPDRGMPPPDRGMPPPDRGMPPPDRGMPPPDRGMPPPDRGMPPPDRGMPPPDRGMPPSAYRMPPADRGEVWNGWLKQLRDRYWSEFSQHHRPEMMDVTPDHPYNGPGPGRGISCLTDWPHPLIHTLPAEFPGMHHPGMPGPREPGRPSDRDLPPRHHDVRPERDMRRGPAAPPDGRGADPRGAPGRDPRAPDPRGSMDPRMDPRGDPRGDARGSSRDSRDMRDARGTAARHSRDRDPREKRSDPRAGQRSDPRGDPRSEPRADPRADPRSDPRADPRGPPRGDPRADPRALGRDPRGLPLDPRARPPEVRSENHLSFLLICNSSSMRPQAKWVRWEGYQTWWNWR